MLDYIFPQGSNNRKIFKSLLSYNNNMDMQELMQELGLSNQESQVYLSLLKMGASFASQISEKTRINRSLVYQILDNLIVKGFVGYVIKNNIREYNAVSPEKLFDLLKEKEDRLNEALPELNNLVKISKDKPLVEILDGKEGIKTILNDIIRVKQDWFAFGSGKATEILPFFVSHWQKQRQSTKIWMRAILNKSSSGAKRGKELSKLKLTEVKYLSENTENPSSTWIYGDRVVVVMWSKEHSFAIRTISKEIAKGYLNYFNSLWKLSKS
jgi:HTH-type transcriptional regulator, sugar sensing transcriptional regulator